MAYQVALALVMGYTTIGVWGMELWQGTARERLAECRCLEYWLGVAKGMGVRVVLPAYSCLLLHPLLYGYDYQEEADYTAGEVAALVQRWQCERQNDSPDATRLYLDKERR